jgi:hypothetical protein
MKKIFGVLAALLLLGACTNPQVPYEQRGSSAISYEEGRSRAESMRSVSFALGNMGTQESRPHENMLNSSSLYDDYSCRDKTIMTPEGVIDIALCIPSWYWRLPASTRVMFVYQSDISERMPLSRVMYLEVSHFLYQRRSRYDCPFTGALIRAQQC